MNLNDNNVKLTYTVWRRKKTKKKKAEKLFVLGKEKRKEIKNKQRIPGGQR
jgi:hypothetical protein